MAAVASIIAFVGMFWLLSFFAASILCSPALFQRLPRRHRVRLPTSDEARAMRQARTTQQVSSKAPRNSVWLYLLVPIYVPMMIALFAMVLLPAFAAMWCCAVCMNFRYFRIATCRVLRRRIAMQSFLLSYPIGLALFVRRMISPKREAARNIRRR
jgi:hypothetical protein